MKGCDFDSVWCYSVYGEDTVKYYEPMRENIRIAREQGARLVVNTSSLYEERVRDFFSYFPDEVIISVHQGDFASAFPKILRFLTCDQVQARFYFYKDSDSVVTEEEIVIMNRWKASADPGALIIRDHPLHISPILAGMFGADHRLATEISWSAKRYFIDNRPRRYHSHCYDQDWLGRDIYPVIAQNATVITSFFYFSNENITRKKWECGAHGHIGAQTYKGCVNAAEEAQQYLSLYRGGLLSIPYYSRLYFLYGRVRPTLAVAWLISVFKKMLPRFNTRFDG